MQSYEVEVKTLLGSAEKAESLRKKMQALDPKFALVAKNKQLNHYFTGGAIDALVNKIEGHLEAPAFTKLKDLAECAVGISVRTRFVERRLPAGRQGEVLLVVKASMGDDTSANGVARMEFEERVDLTLEQLDRILLSAGFRYQAKWSREREEYAFKDAHVCLDHNAGYGWLAEFEKIVDSEHVLTETRRSIDELMRECGVGELAQDRLERMFAFYNEHWPEYYGTEKIFTVE